MSISLSILRNPPSTSTPEDEFWLTGLAGEPGADTNASGVPGSEVKSLRIPALLGRPLVRMLALVGRFLERGFCADWGRRLKLPLDCECFRDILNLPLLGLADKICLS